jgi:hypothetical protein
MLLTAIAVVALGVIAMHFTMEFVKPPNMENPVNGTPWVPHSDALGPWLDGGLAYLFGIKPPFYIYRPTVGMFWGSILSAAGRIEAIPLFFLGWLFLLTGAATLFAPDGRLRAALVVMLGFFAMRFALTWQTLSFDVDLCALVITMSGIILVLWDLGPSARNRVLVGCLCLGVAAAIRGPFMIAGPFVIAIRLFLVERVPLRYVLPAVALFVAPIAFDAMLLKQLGIASNGLQALYCVANDPSHGWTPACSAVYKELQPSTAAVVQGFIDFRLSAAGWRNLFSQLAWRIDRDLAWFNSPATLVLLLGVSALVSRREAARGSITPFVKSAAIVVTLLAISRIPFPWTALVWGIAALLVAAATRSWRAALCLVAYFGSLLFLALTGLVYHDRFIYTFGFTLVLGIALLAHDGDPGLASPRPGASTGRILAPGIAAAVVFLYAGSFVISGQLRETYLREVHGREDAAIKLSGDKSVDRSLYYAWKPRLIYTRHDDLPVGSVRKFRALANDHVGNRSFAVPNGFVD